MNLIRTLVWMQLRISKGTGGGRGFLNYVINWRSGLKKARTVRCYPRALVGCVSTATVVRSALASASFRAKWRGHGNIESSQSAATGSVAVDKASRYLRYQKRRINKWRPPFCSSAVAAPNTGYALITISMP